MTAHTTPHCPPLPAARRADRLRRVVADLARQGLGLHILTATTGGAATPPTVALDGIPSGHHTSLRGHVVAQGQDGGYRWRRWAADVDGVVVTWTTHYQLPPPAHVRAACSLVGEEVAP